MCLHKIKSLISFISVTIVSTGILTILPYVTYGQAENKLSDHIEKKIAFYRQAHPSSTLFVHFDKTLYTNNDNVWFTAYLLNCAKPQLYNTLSVSLVNDIDHKVELEEKFIMANGIGLGNLHLSDSIPPGNYTFMVYTNRMVNRKPEADFTQAITIKTTAPPGFKAILSLTDTSHALRNKTRQVAVIVNGNNYLPLSNALINYRISGKDTTVIEGKAKTDKAGIYSIQVPPGKNIVKVQVKDKRTSQYLYLQLPHNDEHLQVKFYPEGGNLINNLPVNVGWEVITGNGQPLRVQAVLYEDDKAIDTVATNSYGMGTFKLFPQLAKSYVVRLAGHSKDNNFNYKLPAVLPTGFSISMPKSLANDTLDFVVRSNSASVFYMSVHNYRQQFFSIPVQVNAFVPRKVRVALNDLPKGLAEVTLTDSLGRPHAERLFFAHYNRRDQLDIKPDKREYKIREKVQLKVKFHNLNIESQQAIVSVACIQENRLELKKANNIESFFYLTNELGNLPLKQHYLGNSQEDKQYLENVLLIKGWRKYLWTDLLKTTEADTNLIESSVEYTGKISNYTKAPKKPVTFVLHSDSSTTLLETDALGNFKLQAEQLITIQDRKIRFLVDPQKGYEMQFNDPYRSINKKLALKFNAVNFEQPVTSQSTENFVVKGLEHAIQLRAVTVKSSKDNSLYSASNACGDYVCMYNILNCSNHVGDSQNKLPIVGMVYKFNQGTITYSGCNPDNNRTGLTITGIYEAKQFYGADYSVANPSQPEYLSTLFWSHLVKVDSEKDTELSFYTGDITGRFKIVVQGVTTNGVTYSESSITVKKP